MLKINRREMLRASGAVVACSAVGLGRKTFGASPPATVRERKVISHQPDQFHGWPTIARRRNGDLLVVCSGGREAHVCPFGRVELIRSHDGGETWTWPEVVMDSPIDDRDAGVLETAKGSILITTFTSLAYEPGLARAEKIAPGQPGAWPAERLARWQAAQRRVSADERKAALGVWMIRSTDGGLTFSGRYRCGVDSPHGPVQLSDGRLLYAGKELWHGEHRVGVCQSTDDGQTWNWLAAIPTREGDSHEQYHELHAVEAADGRLIAQIRNHNKANDEETLQSESDDGGKTWSVPRPIGVWGLPSHLLRLRDDRLLMTYGYRREPRGNLARISKDHGRTWSEPIVVSDDGTGDIGYPATAELDDGSLVSVWYEVMKGSPKAVLRQAKWVIEG